MFTKQIEILTDIFIEKRIIKPEEKDFVIYGLSIGLKMIFNIFTTIILGFLFGLLLESIVFIISFSLIRIYAGGYHCQKAITCYFVSSGIVVFVLAIIKFMLKAYMSITSTIVLLYSVPILLRWVPVETANKLLDTYEKKYYRKRLYYIYVLNVE